MLLGMSRAPGWRNARVVGAAVFTAALHGVGEVVSASPSLSGGVRVVTASLIGIAYSLFLLSPFGQGVAASLLVVISLPFAGILRAIVRQASTMGCGSRSRS